MITESIFEQGSTHEVCEDYAIHGEGYTILADGCSNGGGPRIDTDWGARILCKAAEEYIGKLCDPIEFMFMVGVTAKAQLLLFPGLTGACLTATLSVLKKEDNLIKGFLVGDGIFGSKNLDGTWTIYTIEFEKGGSTGKSAPFYLKYEFCNEVQTYVDQFGGNYKVTTYHGKSFDNMIAIETQHELGTGYWDVDFCIEDIEFVFHCSDGPMAFSQYLTTGTSKSKESIDVLDVLSVLMDIRGASPGFLRRQRHWAFKQDRPGTFKNRGWFGEDDVSVGVIHIGLEERTTCQE